MNRRDAIKKSALLGGTAVFSASLLTLMQACKETPRLDWTPQLLSTEEAHLVSALVDTILPKTDTPGGLDVKVDMVIDLLWQKGLDDTGQQKMKSALAAFDATCVEKFGNPFAQMTAEDRKTILQEEEAKAPKFGKGVWGLGVGPQPDVGFYRSFKSLAVMAYCTSEEVGKNVLKYEPVPGPFQGCIPFSEVGKVYSL
ncbi:MAG: gluconate 2-dehydrogenase subunit 3 family protein [Bacteroidota bacterium]